MTNPLLLDFKKRLMDSHELIAERNRAVAALKLAEDEAEKREKLLKDSLKTALEEKERLEALVDSAPQHDKQVEDLKLKASHLQVALKKKDSTIAEAQAKIESLTAECKEWEDKYNAEAQKLEDALMDKDIDSALASEEIKNLKEYEKSLVQELEELKAEIPELRASDQSDTDLQEVIDQLTDQLKRSNGKVDSLRQANKEFALKTTELKQQLKDAKNELASKERFSENLIGSLRRDVARFKAELLEAKDLGFDNFQRAERLEYRLSQLKAESKKSATLPPALVQQLQLVQEHMNPISNAIDAILQHIPSNETMPGAATNTRQRRKSPEPIIIPTSPVAGYIPVDPRIAFYKNLENNTEHTEASVTDSNDAATPSLRRSSSSKSLTTKATDVVKSPMSYAEAVMSDTSSSNHSMNLSSTSNQGPSTSKSSGKKVVSSEHAALSPLDTELASINPSHVSPVSQSSGDNVNSSERDVNTKSKRRSSSTSSQGSSKAPSKNVNDKHRDAPKAVNTNPVQGPSTSKSSGNNVASSQSAAAASSYLVNILATIDPKYAPTSSQSSGKNVNSSERDVNTKRKSSTSSQGSSHAPAKAVNTDSDIVQGPRTSSHTSSTSKSSGSTAVSEHRDDSAPVDTKLKRRSSSTSSQGSSKAPAKTDSNTIQGPSTSKPSGNNTVSSQNAALSPLDTELASINPSHVSPASQSSGDNVNSSERDVNTKSKRRFSSTSSQGSSLSQAPPKTVNADADNVQGPPTSSHISSTSKSSGSTAVSECRDDSTPAGNKLKRRSSSISSQGSSKRDSPKVDDTKLDSVQVPLDSSRDSATSQPSGSNVASTSCDLAVNTNVDPLHAAPISGDAPLDFTYTPTPETTLLFVRAMNHQKPKKTKRSATDGPESSSKKRKTVSPETTPTMVMIEEAIQNGQNPDVQTLMNKAEFWRDLDLALEMVKSPMVATASEWTMFGVGDDQLKMLKCLSSTEKAIVWLFRVARRISTVVYVEFVSRFLVMLKSSTKEKGINSKLVRYFRVLVSAFCGENDKRSTLDFLCSVLKMHIGTFHLLPCLLNLSFAWPDFFDDPEFPLQYSKAGLSAACAEAVRDSPASIKKLYPKLQVRLPWTARAATLDAFVLEAGDAFLGRTLLDLSGDPVRLEKVKGDLIGGLFFACSVEPDWTGKTYKKFLCSRCWPVMEAQPALVLPILDLVASLGPLGISKDPFKKDSAGLAPLLDSILKVGTNEGDRSGAIKERVKKTVLAIIAGSFLQPEYATRLENL